ncbi:MAG: orotidine-5'-phosphate decarboxylase [Pseudomonadales bacterium]|nr:orotidine-5'-phosphate decarboxylase [Pseudomonadales bacterium]MDP6472956.1 orotidine-5'-phosphate decarboxylase [Pseudomonadales bacterium]MDP6826288.1 orotidine-5'-phosphate decarboxylase [Pseudomonadales bacterium]MDP6972796.1 orotidine-5'-phosphate decarboxylase [Pseudomonadales bacterium]
MTVRTTIHQRLQRSWQIQASMLCVGLDPIRARIPPHLRERDDALYRFCRDIVDATAPFVCAFKPQAAHFAAEAAEDQLAALISYIHAQYPDLPVVLDAKRGDIGSTAELYAREAFERYDADIVTLSPYLGVESIRPFLDWPGRGVAVLCRTSNQDSAWLQSYPERDPVFLRVARAALDWNRHDNIMLVAGATYPPELAQIRALVGEMPLLIPGVGAQGGHLAAVLASGEVPGGYGLMINSSRGVLYAGEGEHFARSAAESARALRDAMRELANERLSELS